MAHKVATWQRWHTLHNTEV